MKTLLVPTNFLETSKNALTYATVLSHKLKAEIRLLHAYQTVLINPGYLGERQKEETMLFKKDSEKQLKAFCSKIKETASCKCTTVTRPGFAKDVITDYANEIKPDLMIMGTESLGPIDRIVFGTVTGKVIKEPQCPLLIVPSATPYKAPEKIAFAMDYHDSDLEEIRFLVELARKFKAEVHIIHVVSENENDRFETNYFEDL